MVVCPSCHQTLPNNQTSSNLETFQQQMASCNLHFTCPQATLWVPGGIPPKNSNTSCSTHPYLCRHHFTGTPSVCNLHVLPCQQFILPMIPNMSCGVQSLIHTPGGCTAVLNNTNFSYNSSLKSQKNCSFTNKQWSAQDDEKVKALTRTNLNACGWYYGAMTSLQADNLLSKCSEGTFLIRDSSSCEGNYTLSIKTAKGPTSSRIEYETGKYFLSCEDKLKLVTPRFSSIFELVEYYMEMGKNGKAVRQVWVDSQGKPVSPITIKSPLKKEPPSLQHISRLALNNSNKKMQLSLLPLNIQEYLNTYPHKC